MADLSKYTESLSDKKRRLLELMLAEKRRKAAAPEAGPDRPERTEKGIPRRPVVSPVPVSFAQQRLWFIDQLDPGTPAFNIPAAVRIRGTLDLPVMRRGLAEIVRRHETLRTRFGADGGRPVQIVDGDAVIDPPVVDLSRLSAAEQLPVVQRFITAECQRSFDLERCPLVRTHLLRLGEADHVLVLMMHHIIGDVWSVRVLMRELATLCGAFAAGRPSPLPELPIQYGDYALWQREWMRGPALAEGLAYWKGQLTGMPGELELPADHPRPPVQSVWGAKRFLHVPRGLADRVRALGREESASSFMTLLAAWKALLHRYTGQDDIVVGAPVANRSRTELEPLIGFFVNSLVLRTDLSGDPSFRALLRRQREVVLGAFSHQDFPFERLVEVLQPERNMSRNPLFQTDFILQNSPRSAYEVPGLTFEPLPVENGTAQLDMTLDLWEEADGL
ncbi:MAG TPA: condensation domain-containing protein, partial [Thermoanaerobaculia bacterium]|nr:condensation domain-containing protein [Thermoanaerobaculia bacterium]